MASDGPQDSTSRWTKCVMQQTMMDAVLCLP
jgi:hypothetical protein